MGKNGEERCEKMKIAYLILCHTDPKHIRRLVEKVTKGTENEAFVHIDKKADSPAFREALEGLPHVHVLRNNRKVWWGGFSSVDATIRLMREALSYSEQMYAGGGTALCNFTGA